jgi:conjugal transfer pilus assembly protein TraW
MLKSSAFITVGAALLISGASFAADLGKVGHTFKIEEEPFIEMMKQRAAEIDPEELKEEMQTRAKDRIENPIPVTGISKATKDRTFYFDPSYVADRDAVLPWGEFLHRAGARVNPLEHEDFNRRLFFIDSRDTDQVEWLREQLLNPISGEKVPIEDRVILVGGSLFKLQKELEVEYKSDVYFDQYGELTTNFGIKHSPAIATQEGLSIRIDEVNLNNQ